MSFEQASLLFPIIIYIQYYILIIIKYNYILNIIHVGRQAEKTKIKNKNLKKEEEKGEKGWQEWQNRAQRRGTNLSRGG